ncbi:hypothetical protein C8R45DRAFT_942655 [Mycena sanguinolenta]|nr:hypothetical protein C8R45DRAFT_942655 [Mycena sanguinolenta]
MSVEDSDKQVGEETRKRAEPRNPGISGGSREPRVLEPNLKAATVNVRKRKFCAVMVEKLQPSPGLGLEALFAGLGLGLVNLKSRPPQAGPKPGLPGQAGPYDSVHFIPRSVHNVFLAALATAWLATALSLVAIRLWRQYHILILGLAIVMYPPSSGLHL